MQKLATNFNIVLLEKNVIHVISKIWPKHSSPWFVSNGSVCYREDNSISDERVKPALYPASLHPWTTIGIVINVKMGFVQREISVLYIK